MGYWTFRAPTAATNNIGEIELYDAIESNEWFGKNAKRFREELKGWKNATEIHVRINSPGGYVHEMGAMVAALREHGAKTVAHIDGMAASAAGCLAIQCDEVICNTFSQFMLHMPSMIVGGEEKDFRKAADDLKRLTAQMVPVYMAKSGKSEAEIVAMLEATTWLYGHEILDEGFADRIEERAAAAAKVPQDVQRALFKSAPEHVRSAWQITNLMGGLDGQPSNQNKPNNDMDRSKIIAALGLPATASDDEIEAAAKAAVADAKAKTAAETAKAEAEQASADEKARVEAIAALGEKHSQTALAMAAIKAGTTIDGFKDELLNSAKFSDGKTVPANKPANKIDPGEGKSGGGNAPEPGSVEALEEQLAACTDKSKRLKIAAQLTKARFAN